VCSMRLTQKGTALLLIGGDKTGNPNWYEQFVPIADRLFDEHLKELARDEMAGT
jgi:hypothetical protein